MQIRAPLRRKQRPYLMTEPKAEPSVNAGGSSKSNEIENGDNDNHGANQPNDAVHDCLLFVMSGNERQEGAKVPRDCPEQTRILPCYPIARREPPDREDIIMNTANPQLEGLYLALAAINRLLVDKGVASHDELRAALESAQQGVLSPERSDAISASNRKAVAFPIRLLLLANEAHQKGETTCFDALAREIGRRT
jgi:hypothetical protein